MFYLNGSLYLFAFLHLFHMPGTHTSGEVKKVNAYSIARTYVYTYIVLHNTRYIIQIYISQFYSVLYLVCTIPYP